MNTFLASVTYNLYSRKYKVKSCYRKNDFTFPNLQKSLHNSFLFFRLVQQPPVGHGLLITETSRSHSDPPLSVGHLSTIDQPDADMETHNTHKRHTSMSWAGFEPAIPASERPQNHALDRAATGIGKNLCYRFSSWVTHN